MRPSKRRDFLRTAAAAAGGLMLTGVSLRADSGKASKDAEKAQAAFLDAVSAGDLDGVRRRLEKDPGLLGTKDAVGRSAFAIALLHGHAEMGALLRERGFAPDLHESALALDWERFETLAGESPDAVNRDHPVGGSAMYAAAIGGAGTKIWRVYRAGGEPNADPRKTQGHTAVRAALEFPDLSTAELTVASLLGNGADPNGAQPGGSSPLHAAAERDSTAIVEMLIRKGARVDARDAEGRTPQQLAEELGRRASAAVLRKHAEIPRDHSSSRNVYDVEGRPYRAPDLSGLPVTERGGVVGVAHNDLDALRAAVEARPALAHAVATTTEGAVEAGAHMGRADIVDYLLERGAPYSLPTALVRNDIKRARALLEEDPLRVHERGPHDFALLWYPVIGKGLIDMTRLLLEHGAEVERQHWLGTTALHYAAVGGQTEMAELLIEHGADVNRVGRKFNGPGVTPLQIAEGRGHEELVRLLRARGARG